MWIVLVRISAIYCLVLLKENYFSQAVEHEKCLIKEKELAVSVVFFIYYIDF